MILFRLWHRVIVEWRIKFWLGGVITGLFWFGYFRLEQLPQGAVMQMPALAIDRMVPFVPSAAFIYLSQLVIVPLVVWLMISRCQLLRYCRGVLLLIGVSFLVFYFWPTSVVRPAVVPGRHFIYDLVVGADQNRNAFPSLHAAFGLFTAGCAGEVFRGARNSRWLIGMSWVWTVAILASTLLIKQHVFLDLLAGSLLGLLSWWWVGRMSHPAALRGSGVVSSPASGMSRTSSGLEP